MIMGLNVVYPRKPNGLEKQSRIINLKTFLRRGGTQIFAKGGCFHEIPRHWFVRILILVGNKRI